MQFLLANQNNHILYRYQAHTRLHLTKTRGPRNEDVKALDRAWYNPGRKYGVYRRESYVKSLNLFITYKSGEIMKNFKILQDHLPPLIQRLQIHPRPCIKILSVESGTGQKDTDIAKLIKEELQKSEKGRSTRILSRAIEPNEYSCALYKSAIENLKRSADTVRPLPADLWEYITLNQREQKHERRSVKFDIVHFMHSNSFFDIESTFKTLRVEKEVREPLLVSRRDRTSYTGCICWIKAHCAMRMTWKAKVTRQLRKL